MVQILFKLYYRRYIEAEEVLSTVRIGDKAKTFTEGRNLTFVVGSRFKPEVIGHGEVVSATVCPFGDLTDGDLMNATPDAQTPEGMRCALAATSGKEVSDEDTVTLVKWKYVEPPVEEPPEEAPEEEPVETEEEQEEQEEETPEEVVEEEIKEE